MNTKIVNFDGLIDLGKVMKIGFDAKRAFHNNTGLGNYSRFIIEALLKYVPQNECFAYTPKLSKRDLGIKTILPKNKFLWRTWLIKNNLQRDSIQIYHGLSNELPFGKIPNGIKTVVTIHDLIFERYPRLYPFFDTLIYKIKFRYACRNADIIIAVSEQTKRDIIEFYGTNPDKIKVIYQDCDKAFQVKLSSEKVKEVTEQYEIKKKYILSVGSIIERKNQANLVAAFHQLNLSNYQLVLVGGRSKYQEQIEKYIKGNNIPNVNILNKVPFQDLPALYQGASLFVYPSFFEGFGIPIVEALHSGVPVVAATGSCLEEAGGAGALYANPDNIDDLADKMITVLANKDLQKQLIQAGQKHVQQFGAERIAGRLNEIYQELI
ncbi:MAG: glycosyltransferase family 1 protein [Arcicella sp.]|nr:glycosyltransferase family 1 protein [Arcicella sp.]